MNHETKEKYLTSKSAVESSLLCREEDKPTLAMMGGQQRDKNDDNGGKLLLVSTDIWDREYTFSSYDINRAIADVVRQAKINLPFTTTSLILLTMIGSQVNDTYYLNNRCATMFHSVIVSSSGTTKTDTFRRIYAPLNDIDEEAENIFKRELAIYNEKKAERKKAKKTKKSVIESDDNQEESLLVELLMEPHQKDYIMTGNTTVNAIKKFLTDKERYNVNVGTFVYQPEMTSFFEGLGRFYGKATQQAGEIVAVLDGDLTKDGYVGDRYTVRQPHLGMCGAIQPRILLEDFRAQKKMLSQGLFSRFVYSTLTPEKLVCPDFAFSADESGEEKQYTFLKNLLLTIINSPINVMELDIEAQKLFMTYAYYITDKMNYYGNTEDVIADFKQSITFHSTKRIMSLAVITHKINNAIEIMKRYNYDMGMVLNADKQEWTTKITANELKFALAYVWYFNNSFFDFLDNNDTGSKEGTKEREYCERIIYKTKEELRKDSDFRLTRTKVKEWISKCREDKTNDEKSLTSILLSRLVNKTFLEPDNVTNTTYYKPTERLLTYKNNRI